MQRHSCPKNVQFENSICSRCHLTSPSLILAWKSKKWQHEQQSECIELTLTFVNLEKNDMWTTVRMHWVGIDICRSGEEWQHEQQSESIGLALTFVTLQSSKIKFWSMSKEYHLINRRDGHVANGETRYLRTTSYTSKSKVSQANTNLIKIVIWIVTSWNLAIFH